MLLQSGALYVSDLGVFIWLFRCSVLLKQLQIATWSQVNLVLVFTDGKEKIRCSVAFK